MVLKNRYIKVSDDVLSRIELYKEQKIIILYNVDTKEILKGNEDMLNLVINIELFAKFDKIVKELSKIYNPDNFSEFKEIIICSIDSLAEKGFLQYSKES